MRTKPSDEICLFHLIYASWMSQSYYKLQVVFQSHALHLYYLLWRLSMWWFESLIFEHALWVLQLFLSKVYFVLPIKWFESSWLLLLDLPPHDYDFDIWWFHGSIKCTPSLFVLLYLYFGCLVASLLNKAPCLIASSCLHFGYLVALWAQQNTIFTCPLCFCFEIVYPCLDIINVIFVKLERLSNIYLIGTSDLV